MANGFGKPVLGQVATGNELSLNPEMLLVKYHGHPGDDLSPLVIENLSADYRFYGVRRAGGPIEAGWPVKVRTNGYVAVPDNEQNRKILADLPRQKEPYTELTESGHIVKSKDYPPVYELVTDEVTQVSPEQILAVINGSPEFKRQLLDALTSAPAQVAPAASALTDTQAARLRETQAGWEKIKVDAQAILDGDASPAEKKKASAQLAEANEKIAAINDKLAKVEG